MKILFFLVLLYIYIHYNKNIKIGGSMYDNMSDETEKQDLKNKEKDIQDKMLASQNKNSTMKKKNQNIVQKKLQQLIDKHGRGFIVFMWVIKKYAPFPGIIPAPHPSLYALYNTIWVPLEDDENFHIRKNPYFMSPTQWYPWHSPDHLSSILDSFDSVGMWIPNKNESKRLSKRMLSHSLPFRFLFKMDITITQLEIYEKMYKKYFIDRKYPKKKSWFIKKIDNIIKSI